MEVILKRHGPKKATVVEETILFNVTIPAGFETDGASVPRIFRFALSPYTDGLYAAIVHDYQLSRCAKNPASRKRVDAYFYHNLRASGVGGIVSSVAYMLVRIGSWYALNSKK